MNCFVVMLKRKIYWSLAHIQTPTSSIQFEDVAKNTQSLQESSESSKRYYVFKKKYPDKKNHSYLSCTVSQENSNNDIVDQNHNVHLVIITGW